MKKSVVFALFAAVLAGAALVYAQRPHAPEVRFTMLSGESVGMSQFRGKVLLVNFWATYCGSCLKEMPKLVEMHEKFAARGHDIVAVAVKRDDANRVAEFAAARRLPFSVALDGDGGVARAFGDVRVTPSTFVIDREGRILKRYVGEPDWSELYALLERI